jgi:hypothetical protein
MISVIQLMNDSPESRPNREIWIEICQILVDQLVRVDKLDAMLSLPKQRKFERVQRVLDQMYHG